MGELQREGTTIVLISHDLAAVERLCGRAMLLDHGRATRIGPAREVVAAYQRSVEGLPLDAPGGAASDPPAEIGRVALLDEAARPLVEARTGGTVLARISYRALRALKAPRFDLLFYSFEDGVLQSQCTGTPNGSRDLAEGTGCVEFEIPSLGLLPGVYTLGVTISEGEGKASAWHYGRATLYVARGPRVGGRFFTPSTFRLLPDVEVADVVEGRSR
jgi:hypothetical protein